MFKRCPACNHEERCSDVKKLVVNLQLMGIIDSFSSSADLANGGGGGGGGGEARKVEGWAEVVLCDECGGVFLRRCV
jgi:hypothetical protein